MSRDDDDDEAGEGPGPGKVRRHPRICEDFSVPFDLADSDEVEDLIRRAGEAAFRCYLRLFTWVCKGGPNEDYSGAFGGCSRELIERKAKWSSSGGAPGVLIEALIASGLLERVELGEGRELLQLPNFRRTNPFVAATGSYRDDISRKRAESGSKGGKATQERRRGVKPEPAPVADLEANAKQTPSKPEQEASKRQASEEQAGANGEQAASKPRANSSSPSPSPSPSPGCETPSPSPPSIDPAATSAPLPLAPAPFAPVPPLAAPGGSPAPSAAPTPAAGAIPPGSGPRPSTAADPAEAEALAGEILATASSKGRAWAGPWPHAAFPWALRQCFGTWPDFCQLAPERSRVVARQIATLIVEARLRSMTAKEGLQAAKTANRRAREPARGSRAPPDGSPPGPDQAGETSP